MLISELEFGSLWTYCPRTEGDVNEEEIKKSKNLAISLKTESKLAQKEVFMSEFVSQKMQQELDNLPFAGFFTEDTALIPIPKSSLMKADSLWVPDKIARALANKRLGIHLPCLQRIKAVTKSANSTAENRPKAIEHYNSIKIKPPIQQPKNIVLIDDVITRGATMLACASVLREYYPNASIKGFAVIRTISRPEEFKAIKDPCIGKIYLTNEETIRRP